MNVLRINQAKDQRAIYGEKASHSESEKKRENQSEPMHKHWAWPMQEHENKPIEAISQDVNLSLIGRIRKNSNSQINTEMSQKSSRTNTDGKAELSMHDSKT